MTFRLRAPGAEVLLRDSTALSAFQKKLLSWYDTNRRRLPWRSNRDPYRVWISEVMLQQTRVAAVVERYRLFLERFPDVHALAEAAESDVLALWSGLGYYRRARALHAAAKLVCLHYGGSFPNRTSGLRDLPGVGRYTAAAVASIAFNAPVAVVDGNVERVLARMFGNRPLDCWSIAGSLLCRARAGDFNQALMELGATVCLPRGPQCAACPVRCWCRTQGAGTRSQVRKRQRRQVHYRLARRREKVFLVTRPPTASIMPGMWELPELPLDTAVSSLTLRHSITVTDYDVHVSCGEPPRSSQGTWVAAADVLQLPLTGLTRKILRRARVIQ